MDDDAEPAGRGTRRRRRRGVVRSISWEDLAESVRRLRVTDGPWQPASGYRCNRCGGPAVRHPLFPKLVWGCRACGYTTREPTHCFHKADTNGRGQSTVPLDAILTQVRARQKRHRTRS